MPRKRALRARSIGPALGLLAAFACLPLLRLTLVEGFEQKTVDARMRLRGVVGAAPEIAICAIDAASVDVLGQWPWPRKVVADLLLRLHEAGARAIALDVIFSEPSRLGPDQDEALAAAVQEAGNVVLGFYLTSQRTPRGAASSEEILPSPVELTVKPPGGFSEVPSYFGVETNITLLAEATPLAGHFVVPPDSDGTVRHYPLVLMHRGQLYPSLALRAVQVFFGSPPISVRPYHGTLPLVRLGDLEIPASERGELWVNFRGPYGRTFPYYSIAEVLAGTVPEDAFRDRLVIVGATESGIGDLTTSPFDTVVPGVEVHAMVADNLLHGRFIRDGAPETMLGALAVLALGPLCGWLAVRFRRPLYGAALAAGALALYAGFAHAVFIYLSRHLLLIVPVLAGAFGYTAAMLWRGIFAEANARLIRRVFRQFVSDSVMIEMLREPERLRLGGEKRDLTVLFSDVRGFTQLSETLPPEQVVSLLNAYLTPMTEIILEQGGTLDKYMGDAIMAFFGAPLTQEDHAARACGAALQMQERLAALNAEWSRNGLPSITFGVGVNSGPMAVGNMGSTSVFDYTVVGDNVNLGSRLESLTSLYGVDIAVSEHTVARVQDQFSFRELDRVRVKGKREPVRIYELLRASDELGEKFAEAFATALEAYRAGDFGRAAPHFRAAMALRSSDRPTALYLERLEALRASPPAEGWDGITTLAEK